MSALMMAVEVLGEKSGGRVAPHVAARLAAFAHDDTVALAELARTLTPEQLAGASQLPDPLPAVPSVRRRVGIEALTPADRRVLLFAALSVVDSTATLLAAASVETSTILRGRAANHLVLEHGQFRFEDQRVRAVVVYEATAAQRAEAHRRLAQTLRTQGRSAFATWHSALGGAPLSTAREVGAVLAVAEQRAQNGDVGAAQRVAGLAALRASGEARADACLLAGRSALWSGHLADADEWFRTAQTKSLDPRTAAAVEGAETVKSMRLGPSEDELMKSRVSAAMAPLLPLAMTPTDRAVMEGIISINTAFQQGRYADADSMQARLYLGAVLSRDPGPWTTGAAAMSPLAEAHLALLQTAFQTQANDFAGAAVTVHSAVRRLPLVLAGAGIVSSYIRLLAPHVAGIDAALADAFDKLAPLRPISYNLFGVVMGDLSASASRRIGAGPRMSHLPTPWSETLTAREREVAYFLTQGTSNKDIAGALNLSTRTVEVHLGRVYRKMGVRSRSELIARALRPSPTGDPLGGGLPSISPS